MAMNTYADISSYVQKIFEDAMFVARESNIMAGLVTQFTDQNGDASRTNSNYGTATISQLAETDDLASQTLTPSTYQTLTPSEFGAQVFLTDRRIDNDPFGARNDAAQELGMAMAESIETAIISDFPNLNGGAVGSAGTALTWGHIFAAETQLRAKKAPGRLKVILSPFQWYGLGTAASIVGTPARNAPAFQDRVTNNMVPDNVFTVGNLDFYLSAHIATGTASVAAMFAQPALALDTRRPVRLEPERDASRRGWELNMTTVYAHGVWRPEWGVKMTGNSSIPTGT